MTFDFKRFPDKSCMCLRDGHKVGAIVPIHRSSGYGLLVTCKKFLHDCERDPGLHARMFRDFRAWMLAESDSEFAVRYYRGMEDEVEQAIKRLGGWGDFDSWMRHDERVSIARNVVSLEHLDAGSVRTLQERLLRETEARWPKVEKIMKDPDSAPQAEALRTVESWRALSTSHLAAVVLRRRRDPGFIPEIKRFLS